MRSLLFILLFNDISSVIHGIHYVMFCKKKAYVNNKKRDSKKGPISFQFFCKTLRIRYHRYLVRRKSDQFQFLKVNSFRFKATHGPTRSLNFFFYVTQNFSISILFGLPHFCIRDTTLSLVIFTFDLQWWLKTLFQ